MQPLTRRYAFSSSVLSLSLRISEPLKGVDSFKVVSTGILGLNQHSFCEKKLGRHYTNFAGRKNKHRILLRKRFMNGIFVFRENIDIFR
jgi:hypothetical protein